MAALEWFVEYLLALTGLLKDLWLFFLLGFLAAGLVSEFIPRGLLLRYLGRNTPATFLRATLSGMVTSLCSCGAIPIAVTIRKGGASRAAALTFLLAAPWAGFMQLLIFYRFLGLGGTLVVFVGALSVAFFTGLLLGRFEDAGWLEDRGSIATEVEDPGEACCEDGSCGGEHEGAVSFGRRLIRAVGSGREAARELWKYLTIGLMLAAILKAFVPTEWVARYLGGQAPWNPILTAVPVAAAVELCSEGFSIFAGQLHRMGATLPVVFVVVLVGVATDFTELSVIWGKFGRRCTGAYLLTATTLSLLVALVIQQFAL